MTAPALKILSAQIMLDLLTPPYRRGAETLAIPLGLDGPNGTVIGDYDFKEYLARYGNTPPEPRYVLFLKKDLGEDPMQIDVDYPVGSGTAQATVRFPARSFAGTSLVIPVPGDATLRLKAFRQAPLPLAGAGADNFGMLALLGNISKLVWVLGWEKDQIRAQLREVGQQRHANRARGYSLDLLGQDLRVPRFPPREYSPDPDTLALYHFNDDFSTKLSAAVDNAAGAVQVLSGLDFPFGLPFNVQVEQEFMTVTAIAGNTWTVTRAAQGSIAAAHPANSVVTFVTNNGELADETKRLGAAGHPAINRGAQQTEAGKFDSGLLFSGLAGSGFVEIANHPDFDLPANQSFTVEAFVKPNAPAAALPIAFILKGQVDANASLTDAGWAMAIGPFRGISSNLRWSVSDGNNAVEIFGDINIADGKFHHIAGIVDRLRRRARLILDGSECANADITNFGALSNADSIRVGKAGNAAPSFSGVLDELRLSRVVRRDFNPALGESDAAYRQRLGIFERWLLPSPGSVLETVNRLVQINGDPASFILVEKSRAGAAASKAIRVFPTSLAPGHSIDRDGNALTKESDVCGTASAELDFDPVLLLKHDSAQVDYGTDPNNHLMQSAAQTALDALLGLLAAANPPLPGKLIIAGAFNPAAPSLQRVGRSLILRHQNLALEELGVFAFRAGFDFVGNNGLAVRASVAAGEKLRIAIEQPPAAPGIDVFSGKAIDLDLLPSGLPVTGEIKWTLIRSGAGDAHFLSHPADAPNLPTPVNRRPRLRMAADSPGLIVVRVEYTLRRRVVTGTRVLRISTETLADKATISRDGDGTIAEQDAVGPAGSVINARYLISSNQAGVNYGADPKNKQMQIVLERPFNKLVQMPGVAAGLQVLKSFDPADAGLHKSGRAMIITHTTLDIGKLGAMAHQAGFGFVRRDGAQIHCSVAAGELIEIRRAAPPGVLETELEAGTAVDLTLRFDPLPAAGSYNWSVNQTGSGSGSFDFVLRSSVRFTPNQPGFLALNASYFEPLDPNDPSQLPYTFEIKLKPSLDVAATVIPKYQYDLIMNVLNYFHPVGVEVRTDNLRSHVPELNQNPLRAFPAYTYPDFQVPRLPGTIPTSS